MSRMVGPALHGRIARRILVDWMVTPERTAAALPPGLRPRLVEGQAVVGICLIELDGLRPKGLPAAIGRSVSAVAHRISIQDETGRSGVYVPRRDTPSLAAQAVGGRLWPGVHGPVAVRWTESDDRIAVTAAADDLEVEVVVQRTSAAPIGPDLTALHASEPVAWSPGRRGELEEAELRCETFQAAPVRLHRARSSWIAATFGDLDPPRALEMRNIPMRWSSPRASSQRRSSGNEAARR
jgi:hypothetical protein